MYVYRWPTLYCTVVNKEGDLSPNQRLNLGFTHTGGVCYHYTIGLGRRHLGVT